MSNKKADGTQMVNGVAVVAPDNMGKGHKWLESENKYEVATGEGLGFDDNGNVEVQLHPGKSNLLQMKDGKLYYGIEPPANVLYLHVDAVNGVDQDPNVVPGAGRRDKPLRTFKFANSLAVQGTSRWIALHENQTHTLDASDEIAILEGNLTIEPYGGRFDQLQEIHKYTDRASYELVKEGMAPRLTFSGVRVLDISPPENKWVVLHAVSTSARSKVTITGIMLVNDRNYTFPAAGVPYHVKSFARMNIGGELYVSRSAFKAVGQFAFAEKELNAQQLAADKHGITPDGFFSGYSSQITLYGIEEAIDCPCYIYASTGWNTANSTQTTFNVKYVPSELEVAKRFAGFTLDDLGNGVQVVKIPTTNIPTSVWKQVQ